MLKKTITMTVAAILAAIPYMSILSGCSSAGKSITVVDMRYLLGANLNDRAETEKVWDELHFISTLQGVVNRKAPNLYIKYVYAGASCIDEFWWEEYRKEGEWLAGRDTVETDLEGALEKYRGSIKGAVVYDPAVPSTSNVASAVAGADNLVAVRYDPDPESLYSRFITGGPKLSVKVWLVNPDGSPLFTGKGMIPGTGRASTGSLKADPYIWLIENYMKTGRCSSEYGGYYLDQVWLKKPGIVQQNHHCLTNHDFFVSRKAFFLDLSPWGDEPATDDPTQAVGTDLSVLKEMLLTAWQKNKGKKMCYIGGFPSWAHKYTKHDGGSHDDVPTEWEYDRIISAYNALMDADAIGRGAMANSSFWQHFPLEKNYPQDWVTKEELKARGYLDAEGKVLTDKKYMIFYVGDYDAASWVTQTVPSLWNDPARGKEPLMWCISPVLQERAPMAMHYIRKNATPNDYFAAADNGAGYVCPGMLQEPRGESGLPSGLDTWAEHCKKYYSKWGITITGFVIDGFGPALDKDGLDCYKSFSPNGIVPQKCPPMSLHDGMPVLRSGADVNHGDPKAAAAEIHYYMSVVKQPFYWFRNILKSPSWYASVMEELRSLDPDVELLDAPAFFELMRLYLEQNGDLKD